MRPLPTPRGKYAAQKVRRGMLPPEPSGTNCSAGKSDTDFSGTTSTRASSSSGGGWSNEMHPRGKFCMRGKAERSFAPGVQPCVWTNDGGKYAPFTATSEYGDLFQSPWSAATPSTSPGTTSLSPVSPKSMSSSTAGSWTMSPHGPRKNGGGAAALMDPEDSRWKPFLFEKWNRTLARHAERRVGT